MVSLPACIHQSPQAVTPRSDQIAKGRTVYQVSYDLEYGYTFDLAGRRSFPTIAETELPKFTTFFDNANLARLVGKQLFCHFEIVTSRDGSERVVAADLYAR